MSAVSCMPARRDLHNSRVNFLQRDWGPLEPFDDSMPEELKNTVFILRWSAIITTIGKTADVPITPATIPGYATADRGGDFCRADRSMVKLTAEYKDRIKDPQTAGILRKAQDQANRSRQVTESDMPQARTFADGLAFLEENADTDNWFLQIETFDPHEPFSHSRIGSRCIRSLPNIPEIKQTGPAMIPVRPQETQGGHCFVRRLYAAPHPCAIFIWARFSTAWINMIYGKIPCLL